MAYDFTSEQRQAIDARGCSLLVSAAAGSGKTTVLAERIAGRICDKEDPLDLSRVLIVTFTRASAADLKDKLRRVIKGKLRDDPQNAALARQSLKLSSAQISTIHGFCGRLVRNNFQKLGISPKAKIAEESEVSVLKYEIMEDTVNFFYDTEEGKALISDFALFAEQAAPSDAELSKTLIEIYNTLISYPEGLDHALKGEADLRSCSGDVLSGPFGERIRLNLKRAGRFYNAIFDRGVELCTGDPVLEKKYLSSFSYGREASKKLTKLADRGDYSELAEFFADFSPVPIGKHKAESFEELEYLDSKRKEFKDTMVKYRNELFLWSCEDARKLAVLSADILRDLYVCLKEFDRRFAERKRRFGILDYSDLERLSYKLLYNEDGSFSPEAENVRASFDEIYVDEYQDTNRLQDMIFRAVSREDNRFMVGDVKQSIYGFRGAVPEIFSEYRQQFPPYEENGGQKSATVFMSKNFRCDRNVIKFSNAVFDLLFEAVKERFPYGEEDRLAMAKNDSDDKKVRVCLIDKDAEGAPTEAEFIAGEIKKLIDGGTSPSDIAVLLRSSKNVAADYEDALNALGINCDNGAAREYFETPEVLLALCLLNAVDNPTRDVYLAGLMKSPLFAFSLEELVRIKRCGRDSCLYSALVKYTDKTGDKKCRAFLDKLEEYRRRAEAEPVDKKSA
ncbi:MAG: hypothetical protein E7623_04870, partial [Ruminococcaceae bacterium]|nr:hypothetical protein [Oscillospiraceae bacterium]